MFKYTLPYYILCIHIHTNLNRQELAWLARLRTGHCSLNKYLHRFNIEEQPQCPCGNGVETVSHYLLRCRDHDEWRERLRKEVGGDGMSGETAGRPQKRQTHFKLRQKHGEIHILRMKKPI